MIHIEGAVDAPKFTLVVRQKRIATPKGGAKVPSPHLAKAAWRSVPHWDVPPAFADCAKAYSELGESAYIAAVKQYYEGIGAIGVDRAQRVHTKWVVRQVLYAFESHIRGYRHQAVGSRGGALFHTASDELIQPQLLWESGQLVADLAAILSRYQVRSDLREPTFRLVRAKLKAMWGLK